MSMRLMSPIAVTFLIALTGCGPSQPTATQQASMETTVAKPVGEAHANHAAHGAAGDPKPGEAVFKQTCAMCHQTGLSGAPIPGNKQDWQARMAAGKERLYQHAIEGFTGEKGMMPAKGANAALSDADVKSAVDYMLGAVDKAS